jgi:hypothetical protein
MIRFVSTSITSSLNHSYYNAIAHLHNFQVTAAHALGFSVFSSRLLATDLNRETSPSNHYEAFLTFHVQLPLNLGTQLKTLLDSSSLQLVCFRRSLLHLTTACKRPLLSHINLLSGPTENTKLDRYPLLCDVTAYAELCLPSRCLEKRCITPFFYSHVRIIRGVYRAVAWQCVDMSQCDEEHNWR